MTDSQEYRQDSSPTFEIDFIPSKIERRLSFGEIFVRSRPVFTFRNRLSEHSFVQTRSLIIRRSSTVERVPRQNSKRQNSKMRLRGTTWTREETAENESLGEQWLSQIFFFFTGYCPADANTFSTGYTLVSCPLFIEATRLAVKSSPR